MRLTILALALLAFSVTEATAGVPNMTCKAEGTAVGGPPLHQYEATDVFRVANGKLYHRWSGREEYFYNDIKEVELGRFTISTASPNQCPSAPAKTPRERQRLSCRIRCRRSSVRYPTAGHHRPS